MKKLLLATIVMAGLPSSALAASIIDNRGYEACESRLESEFQDTGLTFKQKYYLKRTDEDRTYYINGFVWADNSNRTSVRSTCTTTTNGREVLSLETDFGTYVKDGGIMAAR